MALYTTMKGPVDYTVVGSPTITDGVVSGFANGNYLKTPAFSPGSNPWEIVQTFTTGTVNGLQQGIMTGFGTGTYSVAPFFIATKTGHKLTAYLSSNGSSWDIANDFVIAELQENATYRFKMEFTGSAYNWLVLENNSWTLLKTIETSSPIAGNISLVIGNNRGRNAPFDGTIDLNNTYIKVNDQVWFGHGPQRVKIRTAPYARYTVRNGVTIQNGVASGFAEGNAANAKNIDIPSIYPLTAKSKIHLEFTPTQANFGSLLGKALNNYGYCIRYLSENVTTSYLDIYNTTGRIVHQVFNNQSSIVTGNRHTFDLEYNGTTYTVLIKDIDTNTTIVSGSLNYTQPSNSGTCGFCIGGTKATNYWYVYLKASVNLNNSYIIADGQYVWRGDMQNVETYTLRLGE